MLGLNTRHFLQGLLWVRNVELFLELLIKHGFLFVVMHSEEGEFGIEKADRILGVIFVVL